MKRMACGVAICVLSSVLAVGARAADRDESLNRFFREYLDARFQQQPLGATELGDHRFDSRLEDLSKGSRAKWLALDRKTLDELPRAVEFKQLSPAGQMDYEIYRHDLEYSIWLTENVHPFEEDPRAYNEYISGSVFLLLAQSSLPQETNIANSISRMRFIPGILKDARNNLTNPPRAILENAIKQNRGAISFYEEEIFKLAGETPQLASLRTAAQQVAGALKEYQEFLEKDLLTRANGEWRLGRERFYRKLEMGLDAGMNADQVLADAESEFDRVEREMYVVARQLWSQYFAKEALPPDDADGRRATIRAVLKEVGKNHSEPDKLVSEVRETVARVKAFIKERKILALPAPDLCQIIEMPEFQRGNSTAYMNSPPPLDPKGKGFFAVSPPPKDWDSERVNSYLEEYNRNMQQILTIHEAYPGHYVQMEYANRIPSVIRKVLASGVFVEGWAVYTEQMMLDQGYGDRDLTLRLTQLKFYLRAVANAILDHKMHCDGMTDEQAMQLLADRSYQSEGEARLKVLRAKQSSVQLSTYFVGRMAHYRLRQATERRLGDRFSLARYHEAVLANGSVPVKYLPALIEAKLK